MRNSTQSDSPFLEHHFFASSIALSIAGGRPAKRGNSRNSTHPNNPRIALASSATASAADSRLAANSVTARVSRSALANSSSGQLMAISPKVFASSSKLSDGLLFACTQAVSCRNGETGRTEHTRPTPKPCRCERRSRSSSETALDTSNADMSSLRGISGTRDWELFLLELIQAQATEKNCWGHIQ